MPLDFGSRVASGGKDNAVLFSPSNAIEEWRDEAIVLPLDKVETTEDLGESDTSYWSCVGRRADRRGLSSGLLRPRDIPGSMNGPEASPCKVRASLLSSGTIRG